MALSSEVQASIIKVAGEWALTICSKRHPTLNLQKRNPEDDFYNDLTENFKMSYQDLKSILGILEE